MTSWTRAGSAVAAGIACTADPRRRAGSDGCRRAFPAARSSVPAARAWLREWLFRLGLGEEVSGRAELLLSELAGNAVEHAAGPGFTVRLTAAGGTLQVTVQDESPGGAPRLCRPGPTEAHGRGLAIVDAISDAWGSHRTATGNAVWFRIGCAGTPG